MEDSAMLNASNFKSPKDLKQRQTGKPSVRTPRGNEDIRARGLEGWDDVTVVKHANKFFLVGTDLQDLLVKHVLRVSLYGVVSSTAAAYAWPVKLDEQDDALAAAQAAVERWVRVQWDNKRRKYVVEDPEGQHGDPDWPFDDIDKFVGIAFGGQVLTDAESAVVKEILEKKAA
jgi:hypothetical protein